MLYHYKGWSGLHLGYPFEQLFQRIGVYAVCTFFALSGTSLGLVYARRKVNPAFLFEFGLKRFFRIAPLFWTATILTILVHWILLPRLGVDPRAMPAHPLLLACASSSLLFGWVRQDAYVPVGGWSIGDELVFYSLFPGFLVLMRPAGWRSILTFVAALAVGLWFADSMIDPNAELGSGEQWPFYINAMNHLFLFVGGMMLAILHDPASSISPRWLVAGLLLLLAAFVFWPTNGLGGSILVAGWRRLLFSGISLGFCYVALCWPFHFGSFAHVFIWIGNISYAVYLLHPIASDITQIINFKFLHWNTLLISCALGVPLTLLLATLSWKFLEKPFMRSGRNFADKLSARHAPAREFKLK